VLWWVSTNMRAIGLGEGRGQGGAFSNSGKLN